MNVHPEFHLVDQQPDNAIMHQFGLRETDSFSCQTLDPSSQVQVFTLDFLGVALTNFMLVNIEMAFVSTPVIGIIVGDTEPD